MLSYGVFQLVFMCFSLVFTSFGKLEAEKKKNKIQDQKNRNRDMILTWFWAFQFDKNRASISKIWGTIFTLQKIIL